MHKLMDADIVVSHKTDSVIAMHKLMDAVIIIRLIAIHKLMDAFIVLPCTS